MSTPSRRKLKPIEAEHTRVAADDLAFAFRLLAGIANRRAVPAMADLCDSGPWAKIVAARDLVLEAEEQLRDQVSDQVRDP